MGLLLEAVDVAGPLRWRWLLQDEETGNPVADHQVRLDPASDEVARFRDLYGYVRSYAVPDRRTEDGVRLVSEAGAWAGRELLGESVGAAIVGEAPVTVRVKIPAALDSVLLWPLELAHVDGKPLAAHIHRSYGTAECPTLLLPSAHAPQNQGGHPPAGS